MGIELHLDIMPSRITPEAWSKVYSDSLVLTDNYPFMDKYYGYRDNGLEYIYGAHTRERDDIYGRFRGWRSVGDLWTGYNTEEFALKANIEDYRRHGAKDEGDMVASLVYGDADEYPELNIPEADSMVSAFYAKTQGEDSHLYLLAIACMVADRLPGAAVVSGDINAGQCRAAVNWANQYLSEPIMVPVQCDAVRLMHRILLMDGASQLMEDGRILDLFFRISLENRDARMGDVLRKRVSEKVIATYYHRKFSGAQKNGLPALERETKEYLELGFDLRHLLGVLVTDPDGCRLQLDDFLD
ncbi:MAG: hypothetical protein LIP12_00375, partial [Clostridiales bacterium]|nr:hypothetical protein [Clostridiales bacterium]